MLTTRFKAALTSLRLHWFPTSIPADHGESRLTTPTSTPHTLKAPYSALPLLSVSPHGLAVVIMMQLSPVSVSGQAQPLSSRPTGVSEDWILSADKPAYHASQYLSGVLVGCSVTGPMTHMMCN